MKEDNEITQIIVDAAMKVHKSLGPGLFESVYQKVLPYELEQRGLHVQVKQKLPIRYGDLLIPEAFEVDLIVDDRIIAPVHSKQLMTYLRLTGLRVGLLFNFNIPLLKDAIIRLVNGYESDKSPSDLCDLRASVRDSSS